ncbi:unnamed protein product [Paramecium octaurelia]|uniref:Uncharacterized protein n=1 Tax=Paramecium octaurelia TaxID=43137 RepID=A0A8S1VC88_PAROT|nr:unnamed protein product [Paramecium octaurelia]
MYYPYEIQESEENGSDVFSYADQSERVANSSQRSLSDSQARQEMFEDSAGSYSDNEDQYQDVQLIDQSRIVNLQEVKVFLDEVICPICFHIIIDPKICKECDQAFCSNCIERWFQKSVNQQCPCCRKGVNKRNECVYGKVPKVMLNLLSKLMLTCRYSSEGCEEIISYDFREKHENQYCQFQEQTCKNFGCYETMYRKDFEDHQLECKYGIVYCKYCSKDKLRMDIELHLQECDCRPILCEWCQEKFQHIEIDDHIKQCEFKDIICEYCKRIYKQYDMEQHTPINCLKSLYKSSLELSQQKDEKILQLQRQIELLKHTKSMEQSDLNQSTDEILSEKYKQDFEVDVEEVIEEDIQIEDSEQEQFQQNDGCYEKQNNSDQKSENLSDDDNQDQQNTDEQLDFAEIPSIQEIKMRGLFTSFLEKFTDNKFKDLWDWSEDELNQVIDWLK